MKKFMKAGMLREDDAMTNVILTDAEELIGFISDIRDYYRKTINDYVATGNWEMVSELADLMLDLNGWADNPNLLIISENNGMGYTIKEYVLAVMHGHRDFNKA